MRNKQAALEQVEALQNQIVSLERSVGPTMQDVILKESVLYQPIEKIKERLQFIFSLIDREPETF